MSATSTSTDGRPGNNDGTSPNAIVTTVVDAAPPANQPPVVDDVSFDWIPTQRLTGVVPMSDPDAGQVVTASLTTPAAHGTATVGPDGAFEWVPTGAFTGIDTFVVTGCDNGSPSLCDTGTVTITVAPLPADDTATTTDGVAVNVDIAANDLRRHGAAGRRERPGRRHDDGRGRRVDHLRADARVHGHGHLRLPGLQHGLADGLRAGDGHDRGPRRPNQPPAVGGWFGAASTSTVTVACPQTDGVTVLQTS